jgi:hypothetical protein
MNAQYKEADPYYNTIRRSFNKWVGDAVNSHLFSGDESALADVERYRKLYANASKLNPDEALARFSTTRCRLRKSPTGLSAPRKVARRKLELSCSGA